MVFTKEIKGVEVEMKASLRVAHELQKMFNKPYQKVFAEMATMPIEDQIGILYASYRLGCKDGKPELTKNAFLDYYLDSETESLDTVMSDLEKLVEGISGKKLEELVDPLENKPGESSLKLVPSAD